MPGAFKLFYLTKIKLSINNDYIWQLIFIMSKMKCSIFKIFRKSYANIFPIVFILAIVCGSCLNIERETGKESNEEGLRQVLQVQRIYNLNPDEDIVPELKSIIDSMRNNGRDEYYFAATNVLIDRLFSYGRYAEADSLAVKMKEEAEEDADSTSMAIARRVRAQMFYKLSQPYRALDELRPGSELLRDPLRSVATFGTATSILEWMWIIEKSVGDTVNMNRAGEEYARLVEEASGIKSWNDSIHHFPVTALSFKAQAALTSGDTERADLLLDSAAGMIKKGIPARAYEHFYNVRSAVRGAKGDYSGALEDVDTLLLTHRSFPWFYLDDLLLKARMLEKGGRCKESAGVYSTYVEMHDSISSRLMNKRLQDLTVLYSTEIEKEHKRVNTFRLLCVGGVAVFLLLLFGLAAWEAIRERKRNRLLVERLKEYDRATESVYQEKSLVSEDELSDIESLDRFMKNNRPYTNPALGRKELAEYSGLSMEEVGQLIRTERGCTVRVYINSFRLEEARRILQTEREESISEIAVKLGFGTARTFQRAFKERYDMSPSQYRSTVSELGVSH